MVWQMCPLNMAPAGHPQGIGAHLHHLHSPVCLLPLWCKPHEQTPHTQAQWSRSLSLSPVLSAKAVTLLLADLGLKRNGPAWLHYPGSLPEDRISQWRIMAGD